MTTVFFCQVSCNVWNIYETRFGPENCFKVLLYLRLFQQAERVVLVIDLRVQGQLNYQQIPRMLMRKVNCFVGSLSID